MITYGAGHLKARVWNYACALQEQRKNLLNQLQQNSVKEKRRLDLSISFAANFNDWFQIHRNWKKDAHSRSWMIDHQHTQCIKFRHREALRSKRNRLKRSILILHWGKNLLTNLCISACSFFCGPVRTTLLAMKILYLRFHDEPRIGILNEGLLQREKRKP